MKLHELEQLERKQDGYRVSFERVVWPIGHLSGDVIPDYDESPCQTENEAWDLAERVANAGNGDFVNICVIGKNGKATQPDVVLCKKGKLYGETRNET